MKRGSKKIIAFIVVILLSVIFALKIPFSKTKNEFNRIVASLASESIQLEEVYTEESIANLPTPVQKYMRYCGFIGTPKKSYMKINYHDVKFSFGKDKPVTRIDYLQHNFVNEPNRIAYIDSSTFGIPFEGLDAFFEGTGSMKGVIGKLFVLFNQTGKVMDKSALVTFLSEILFFPNAALQSYVKWEAIDDFHANAIISCYGMSASGIFAFNEKGEMISFVTDDRSAIASDGSSEAIRWSICCDEYKEVDGIRRPTVFKAIWHYGNGELIYFDGEGTITEYN